MNVKSVTCKDQKIYFRIVSCCLLVAVLIPNLVKGSTPDDADRVPAWSKIQSTRTDPTIDHFTPVHVVLSPPRRVPNSTTLQA